jgi:hypothetical protein
VQQLLQHTFILKKEHTMPNTSKSSKKATPAAKADFTEVFTPLCLNGVARVAELQKNSLDIAAEQTAEWIGACKNAFSFLPVATPTFFFDVFGQAVETCVETQKSAIDLATEQTKAVTGIAKQRANAYAEITESTKAAFQTTVTRSVEAQKKVLEFAGAQSKAISQAAKKQIGVGPVAVLIDSFERGANTLIEAQKSILEASTKPLAANA